MTQTSQIIYSLSSGHLTNLLLSSSSFHLVHKPNSTNQLSNRVSSLVIVNPTEVQSNIHQLPSDMYVYMCRSSWHVNKL